MASSGSLTQAYEERFLFLLVLLRQPRLRMVYVTSMPIAPEIIEYYLALLPGVIPSHARARLSLVAVHDASPRSLSEKLLERPRLLGRIAAMIPNPERSHLVPYNTTELERDVALSLGIPMYGADPRLAPLGSKSGCRRMFAEVGVPHPLGVENLRTLDDLADAAVGMRAERPSMDSLIVKLNEGVSGAGNAVVRLSGLPPPGSSGERGEVMQRLREMELESPDTPFDVYIAKFAEGAGIVEERITGEELLSPSVQLRVLPGGDVELLSTHDQLLGGASGQSYLGCTFPAAPEYARTITEHAATIGHRLAREGALGRFAVDFVVVRSATGEWTPYAIELNLRKGGTTHPFLTLQFLTDGRYDPGTALFLTPRGHEKHLVATDHLESDTLRGLMPADLFDIVARHGLHFDQSRQVGVVFHMISSLTEHGRVGLTAVGDTPAEADRRYRDARADPAGGGAAVPRGTAAAGLRARRAEGLVRRLRVQPGHGAVPLLPVRRAAGRRQALVRRLPGSARTGSGRRPRGRRAGSCSPGGPGCGAGAWRSTTRGASGRVAVPGVPGDGRPVRGHHGPGDAPPARRRVRPGPGGAARGRRVVPRHGAGPLRDDHPPRRTGGGADVHGHARRHRRPGPRRSECAVPAVDRRRAARVPRLGRRPHRRLPGRRAGREGRVDKERDRRPGPAGCALRTRGGRMNQVPSAREGP